MRNANKRLKFSLSRGLSAVALGLLMVTSAAQPVQAGPPLATSVFIGEQTFDDIKTDWGYGSHENAYNDLIVDAVAEHWTDKENPLDPLAFKALIAVESAFKTQAFSRTGCAGLVQLTPDTAKRFGLSLHPVDERLIPAKAIPAGVKALAEKHRVIMEPDNYFGILLDRPEKKCPYGTVVNRHYSAYGTPEGQNLMHLGFASYNGGGGTVMRAMSKAVEMGKDPLDWNSLVGTGPADSPLYSACQMVYRHGAPGKYKEMRDYSGKIFRLLRKGRS